jgi:Flp pilus assembly protein TadB
VLTGEEMARSNTELPSLVRSHRARAMALGWLAASFVLGAIAAMTAGVALLVWVPAHLPAVILGAIAVAAASLAWASLRRSRQRRTEARDALDRAWELVAREVLDARPGATTAPDLARIMSTDLEHAEGLLGRLSAHGDARVDVRDDAELAYRIDPGSEEEEAAAEPPGPRLRAP